MDNNAIELTLPEVCLVVLIGASGSGKSTFAKNHFLPTEVLSSDFFRGMVSDDANSQKATGDAFEALHFVAGKRLANLKLTVVDATNVQAFARNPLITLAKEYHVFPVAIVLDMPEDICKERNKDRPDRAFGDHVIGQQRHQLHQSLRRLRREGFRRVYTLRSEDEVARVQVVRERLWTNRRDEVGPFDVIGDVHGCYDELVALLVELGYEVRRDEVIPPAGRRAIFLGDLVDRGPKSPQVVKLVMGMVNAGTALCVPGNHDVRLVRALQGRNVKQTYGLAESMTQFAEESEDFRKEVAGFFDGLVSHYVLDEGRLVVAHGGMKEEMAGRSSGAVRSFALYGESTGETDADGFLVRVNWAADYRGEAMVIYGHTPVVAAEWLNNTMNIDTGCVFGGALTALRYPEKELVSVPSRDAYAEHPQFGRAAEEARSAQQAHDDVLDVADFLGKHVVDTALIPRITIRDDHAAAALEVMSRFAVDSKWLVYLPPTMAAPETSVRDDVLEHPDEVFGDYRASGLDRLMCQEKHMGSRVVVVVCKDEGVGKKRFGTTDGALGVCYTRTGRRFFDEETLEVGFLGRVRDAVGKSGLWEALETDWVVLDCEVMPWSARAQQLLQDQYAAVGASAKASLDAAVGVLQMAEDRGIEVDAWLETYRARRERMDRYVEAYRAYCWPVSGLENLKVAPFHVLASEGGVHSDQSHMWHMGWAKKLSEVGGELFAETAHRVVDLDDEKSCAAAVDWWAERTASGSEGMVVKPLDFVARSARGRLVQPGVKCRGRDYLRIIYGPEYTVQLELLRRRHVRLKQSLALREFALGLEGLNRFVKHEPLRRVHACVFGVLALESEPVDPRL